MGKGKRFKKNNKKRKIIIKGIQIIFIIAIIYSGIKIFNWIKENNQNQEVLKEISESISIDEKNKQYKIDFETLKMTNNDIIAWIKVNGTNIEYPVVKSSNNEYYLTHSLDKSINTAGWVFADYRNKLDNNDKNIIIYGHNRRDGSMFGTLKNILTEEWYKNKENQKIIFITENGEFEYQVFSVYNIELEDYYIQTDFDENSYLNFINTIKNRSIYNFETEVTTQNSILTLSTCDDNNKYRVVLHAVKLER